MPPSGVGADGVDVASWTQAERDTLAARIATAVQAITFGDRSISYADLDKMRALLAEMDRQLQSSPGYRLAATSKGV